jgi:hypothetical protein
LGGNKLSDLLEVEQRGRIMDMSGQRGEISE